MVAVDDSDVATKALLWAVQEVVGPSDEVHLVSVALPVPYPVSLPGREGLGRGFRV